MVSMMLYLSTQDILIKPEEAHPVTTDEEYESAAVSTEIESD